MTRLLIGPLLRHVGTTDATVWVETDEPCDVAVLGIARAHLDGGRAPLRPRPGRRPRAGHDRPVRGAPRRRDRLAAAAFHVGRRRCIRTQGDGGALRLAFGSCRYGRAAATLADRHFTPDSLASFARDLVGTDISQWPDAFLMLGDQVYADETSTATQRRIRAKRDIASGSKDQVADFEEYTWLYLESWTDPDVRWLLVQRADRDDLRRPRRPRRLEHLALVARGHAADVLVAGARSIGGLASYWVYQHLGNLSPAELADDPLYQRVARARR